MVSGDASGIVSHAVIAADRDLTGLARGCQPRCAKDTGLRDLPLQATTRTRFVPDRRPDLRTAGLDSDARAHRPRPPLGTKAAAAAAVLRRRAHRPRRTPATAPPRRPMALDWPDHLRDRTAPGTGTRKEKPRARGTPPTRRDSRAAINDTTLKAAIRPQPQATETRSRKSEVSCMAVSVKLPAITVPQTAGGARDFQNGSRAEVRAECW
jgi:hypothetical protein